MNNRWFGLLIVLIFASAATAQAADKETAKDPAKEPHKLKALYITGGGWHDYKKLEPMVTEGIAKHANIDYDVKWGAETLAAPNFGDGYDVIIYNLCVSGELDKDKTPADVIENAVKATRAGKPTVMLHASMHSFADVPAWTEMCGQKSREHDNFAALTLDKVAPDDPIIKPFPEHWQTKGDELYHTLIFPSTSKALLKCTSKQTGKENIVCWTSKYGEGRVFGCTLGHDAKTATNDDFHRLVANGVLWACDKLGADGQPAPGYGAAAKDANSPKQPDKNSDK